MDEFILVSTNRKRQLKKYVHRRICAPIIILANVSFFSNCVNTSNLQNEMNRALGHLCAHIG